MLTFYEITSVRLTCGRNKWKKLARTLFAMARLAVRQEKIVPVLFQSWLSILLNQ